MAVTFKDINRWKDRLGYRDCKVQRQIDRQTDRQVWLQGLQRLRGTKTDTHTALVTRHARLAKVERYRDIETDRYVCKGCNVQRHIDRQVWLQGLQRLQGTETYRKTAMVAKVAKVARYRDRQTGMVARFVKVARYRDI